MKKILLITVMVVISIATLMSFDVLAASQRDVKAFFSDISMFLNGNRVDKDVVVVNGSSYLPVRAISEILGIEVNWDGAKKQIDLKSPTSNLKQENEKLQSENNSLKKQIDDLNSKLAIYRGDIPSDDSYKPINNFTYINSDGYLYNSNWNKVTPFKVNNKVFDKNVCGIKFNGGTFSYGDFNYPAFTFDNKNLAYSSLKFSCAIDDLAKSFDYPSSSIVIVVGFSTSLGDSTLLTKHIDRNTDINTYEVNIKGYDSIAIVFRPYMSGAGTVEPKSAWKDYYNYSSWSWLQDYILFINPQVK